MQFKHSLAVCLVQGHNNAPTNYLWLDDNGVGDTEWEARARKRSGETIDKIASLFPGV